MRFKKFATKKFEPKHERISEISMSKIQGFYYGRYMINATIDGENKSLHSDASYLYDNLDSDDLEKMEEAQDSVEALIINHVSFGEEIW